MRWVRRLAWGLVGVFVVAAGAYALWSGMGQSPKLPNNLPFAASFGGPFELTDHTGRRFTDKDLAGKPYALFFGFTHCPDVCPTTLIDLTNTISALGDDADKMAFVMVSVDPERDTPEHLARYLKSFDKRIVGLTGSVAAVRKMARSYRAFFEKVPTKDGYTMNHTASVFLFDSQGKFAGTLAFQEKESNRLAKLKRLVGAT